MTAPTRFSTTTPLSTFERWVVVLLYAVVLLPVAGVVLMMATGRWFGLELGGLGEVPGWMAVWVLAGAVLFALVGVWGVRMVAEWIGRQRTRV
jgi:hypothetical protein